MLGAAGFGLGGLLIAAPAHATLVRGLSLETLATTSQRILVATALEASSHWEELGGRRRIVTDTRLRVEDVVAANGATDSEVMVRTLGGTVGDLAARVFGEALLGLDERCVLFLIEQPGGIHRVMGMAQGHYPVRPDEQRLPRLRTSPQMPELAGGSSLAVSRLPGQELPRAKTLILEALSK